MKTKYEYLSDEELEQLILNVEQNELVAAPPDFSDGIMQNLDSVRQKIDISQGSSEQEINQSRLPENKVKEFRGYCIRVFTSVAAAVLIVFMLPEQWNIQLQQLPERHEVIELGKYATREEVLKDTSLLTQTLGGTNIFKNENKFNIFNEKNGG